MSTTDACRPRERIPSTSAAAACAAWNKAIEASLEDAERVQRQAARPPARGNPRAGRAERAQARRHDKPQQPDPGPAPHHPSARIQRTMDLSSSMKRTTRESHAAFIWRIRSPTEKLGRAAASQAANAGNQDSSTTARRRRAAGCVQRSPGCGSGDAGPRSEACRLPVWRHRRRAAPCPGQRTSSSRSSRDRRGNLAQTTPGSAAQRPG